MGEVIDGCNVYGGLNGATGGGVNWGESVWVTAHGPLETEGAVCVSVFGDSGGTSLFSPSGAPRDGVKGAGEEGQRDQARKPSHSFPRLL